MENLDVMNVIKDGGLTYANGHVVGLNLVLVLRDSTRLRVIDINKADINIDMAILDMEAMAEISLANVSKEAVNDTPMAILDMVEEGVNDIKMADFIITNVGHGRMNGKEDNNFSDNVTMVVVNFDTNKEEDFINVGMEVMGVTTTIIVRTEDAIALIKDSHMAVDGVNNIITAEVIYASGTNIVATKVSHMVDKGSIIINMAVDKNATGKANMERTVYITVIKADTNVVVGTDVTVHAISNRILLAKANTTPEGISFIVVGVTTVANVVSKAFNIHMTIMAGIHNAFGTVEENVYTDVTRVTNNSVAVHARLGNGIDVVNVDRQVLYSAFHIFKEGNINISILGIKVNSSGTIVNEVVSFVEIAPDICTV